jgi:WD40 repeat protein
MVGTFASSAYDVFLSYSSADHASVEPIAAALTERGLRVFLDRWELVPGRSWPEALEQYIASCRSVAVVLGASGMGTWQQREQLLALNRQARDSSFGVIPVLLPGADPALGFLALNTWIDLRAGVGDSATLDLLAAAVRGEAPATLLERSRRTCADVCPYRGLEVFREEDAPFFFGREALAQRLLERTSARDFLAVVGASGSGKSSVVRAGLIPMLRRGATDNVWDILTLTPGTEPLAALARALDPPPAGGLIATRAHVNAAAASLRAGDVRVQQLIGDHLARQPGTDRLLLVIDQFEELATLTESAEEASRFVDLLLEATGQGGGLTVLITLRSDFYTQIVHRRDLSDRLQDAVVQIGPLSPTAPEDGLSELETIIRRPAEAVSLDFEDGLVARITSDVGAEPGNLPLLEYLLTELWRRRGHGLLTHEAYEGLGGVQGAIARRADEAYERLAPEQQRAARRLFLSLVRPEEGQRDTRTPAPFPDDPLEVEVARRFSGPKVRLLVADEDALRGRVLQVSHEALIRNWSRLRDWVDQSRETLRVRERVRQRMRRWQEKEAEDLLLPPGLELEEGRRLLEAETDVSVDEVRGYIERSIAAEESRVAEREAHQEAERQRELAVQRQKRRLVSSALAVSLLLLALAALQWQRAEEQRAVAHAEAQRANSEADLAVARRLSAISDQVFEENPGETALAAMIAIDAQERRGTAEGVSVLRRALNVTPTRMPEAIGPADWPGLQVSRDGRVLAYYREDTWNASNDDVSPESRVHVLSGEDLSTESARDYEALAAPVFSPDGRWLATGGFSRRLAVVNLATGETLVDETARTSIWPAFSPDGQTLYVARADGVIERRKAPGWEMRDRLFFPVERDRGYPVSIDFDPDGTRLLVRDLSRAAYLVPADGGEPVVLEPFQYEAAWYAQNNVSAAAVARDRPIGLTQRRRGKAVVWDLETGRQLLSFQGEAIAWSAGISPDGAWIATAARTGKVSLRRVEDGKVFRNLDHGAKLQKMAVSPDGSKVATAGEDGSVIVWTVEGGEPAVQLSLASEVEALVFDRTDGSLLIGTGNGRLTRLDPTTGRVLSQRRFGGAVAAIAPGGTNGRVAVSIRATDAAMHWDEAVFIDRDTGRERAHLVRNGDFRLQTLGPKGARFATYDDQHRLVEIWDTATAQRVAAVPDVKASSLAFGADGKQLVVGTVSDQVIVIAAETGAIQAELGEPGGVADAVFPLGEDQAITQGPDGTIRGWDLLTGAELWRSRFRAAGQMPRFSGDGRRFALWNEPSGTIDVAASKTGRVVASIPAGAGRGGTLSSDGLRLLVRHQIDDPGSSMGRSTELEVWDVDAKERLHVLQRPTPIVSVSRLQGGAFALVSKTVGVESILHLDVVEGASGRPAWEYVEPGTGSFGAIPVRGEKRWLLVVTPDALQLRNSTDGHIIWQVEPVSYLEHASAVPGGTMIALAAKPATPEGDWQIYLHDAATGGRVRTIPIGGFAHDIAASADGAHIVVGGEGDDWRGLRVWRIADGALVGEIEMDAEPSELSALSDPDLVAVRDFSNNLRVWRLSDGAEVQRIAHTRSADRSVVARDQPRVLTASGASLRLWDLATGGEIGHHVADGKAKSPRLSPDGHRVAYIAERPRKTKAGGSYRVAMLWEPEVLGQPATLPIDEVQDLELDRSGRYLLLHGRKGAFLRVVDVATLRTVGTVRPLRKGKLVSFDGASDGSMLLVNEEGTYPYKDLGFRRHGLRVFDLPALTELARTDVYGSRFFALDASGAIAAQGADKRWRIFDPRRTGVDRTFEGEVYYELHAAPGSRRLLTPRYYGLYAVDADAGVQQTLLEVGEPDFVTAADLNATGALAAVSLARGKGVSQSGEILILDAQDGSVLARRKLPQPLHSVHFADQGEAVVATRMPRSGIPTEAGELTLHWRWREDSLAILEDTNPVRGVAVTPDGAVFATAEGYLDDEKDAMIGERRIRIWSGADGAEIARIPIAFNAYGLVFSQDGRHLAATGYHEVTLFQADDWSLVTDFGSVGGGGSKQPADRPESLGGRGAVFGSGGRLLVIGQERGLFVFNIATEETTRLHETQRLGRMAVSRDGGLLATSGNRFTTIWDMVAGQAISRLETGKLAALAFGGDTGEDLFAIRNRRLFQLTWRPERLIREACERFRNADWRNGRVRVIGERGPHRCEGSATP